MSKLLNLQQTVPEVRFKPVSAINLQAVDTTPIINSLGRLSQAFTETAKTRTKMDSLQYMNKATKEFLDRSRQDKDYSFENYDSFKETLKEEVGEMFGGVYQDTTDWVNKSLDKTLEDSHKVYGMEMSTNFFNDTTQDIRTKINDGADLSIIKELTLSAVSSYDAMHEVGFLDSRQLEAMTVKSHYDALEYGYQQTLDKALEGVSSREEAEAIVKRYSKINSVQIQALGGRGDEDVSRLSGAYGAYARSLPSQASLDFERNTSFSGNTRIDFAENIERAETMIESGNPDEVKEGKRIKKVLNERVKIENVDGDSVGLLIHDRTIPADLPEGAMYVSSIKDHLSGMRADFDENISYDENLNFYMNEFVDADKGIRRKDTILLFPENGANYHILRNTLDGLSTKEKVEFAYSYANGKINLEGKPINNKAIKGEFTNPHMKQILFNSVAKAGGFSKGDFIIYDPSNKTDTTEIDKVLNLTNGMSDGDVKAGLVENGYETKSFLKDVYDGSLGNKISAIRSVGGEHAKLINQMKPTFDKMFERAGATGNLDKAQKVITDVLEENFPSVEFDGRTVFLNKERGSMPVDSREIKNLYSEGIAQGKYYYKTAKGDIPITNTSQFTIRNDGVSETDYWTLRQDPTAFVYTKDASGKEVPVLSDILADQTRVNEAKNSRAQKGATNTYLNRIKNKGDLGARSNYNTYERGGTR